MVKYKLDEETNKWSSEGKSPISFSLMGKGIPLHSLLCDPGFI